jgi:hypothetical protein
MAILSIIVLAGYHWQVHDLPAHYAHLYSNRIISVAFIMNPVFALTFMNHEEDEKRNPHLHIYSKNLYSGSLLHSVCCWI